MARIEKLQVWSGWLRLSHLAVGLASLVLLATGWLIEAAPSVQAGAIDAHYIAASVLLFGLVLRVALAIWGSPLEAFDRLIPDDEEWRTIRETLLFYLTLGRAPLPRWYAHNPFWKPVYLVLYLCLLVLLLTGWVREGNEVLWGWYLPSVHALFASVVGWLVLFHVITVVLHDYRGDAADVSGIINGNRHFVIETPETPQVSQPVAEIKLTDMLKGQGKSDS